MFERVGLLRVNIDMSARLGAEINTEEIVTYLEKLKQEKKITDHNLMTLEREKNALDEQIAELQRRREEVYARYDRERGIVAKQDSAIKQAETAYFKIVESSRSLADYLRREFKEARNE